MKSLPVISLALIISCVVAQNGPDGYYPGNNNGIGFYDGNGYTNYDNYYRDFNYDEYHGNHYDDRREKELAHHAAVNANLATLLLFRILSQSRQTITPIAHTASVATPVHHTTIVAQPVVHAATVAQPTIQTSAVAQPVGLLHTAAVPAPTIHTIATPVSSIPYIGGLGSGLGYGVGTLANLGSGFGLLQK